MVMLLEFTLLQWQHVWALLMEKAQLAAEVSAVVWAMLKDHTTFAAECMYDDVAAAICMPLGKIQSWTFIIHQSCRALLPVDLGTTAPLKKATIKSVSEHPQQAVIPVKWDGSWAVLFLDAPSSRFVLAALCGGVMLHCLTSHSLTALAPTDSTPDTDFQSGLLPAFRFVCRLCADGASNSCSAYHAQEALYREAISLAGHPLS